MREAEQITTQTLQELTTLRHRVAELESLAAGHQKAAETLQHLARQAKFSADIDKALIHGDTLQLTLQDCTEALVRHLDAAFVRIWTLNGEGKVLELQASAGMYTHLDGPHSRIPMSESKVGLIAHKRQPYLTNTVPIDPLTHDHAWARREGIVAFAGYPLVAQERLVGVIALFARRPLTESDCGALE